jgi:hypothetical protein
VSWFETVPREVAANLAYRREIYRRCAVDPEFREVVREVCREEALYFVAVFGWIEETRLVAEWQQVDRFGDRKVLPFIPRGYQARAMQEMLSSLGRRDILIPKSRETGVSWMCVALAAWDWHFHGADIGVVSRDEGSVDSPGTGSLFAKIDFYVRHLPRWMRCLEGPDYSRNLTHHTFVNHRSGGSIHGVASGANIFRGDRKKWVLMDEAHFFPKESDYLARDSLVGVTRSRVMVSTLNRERGASGAFFEAWQDADANSCVIELDWSEDADKRVGLYRTDKGRLKLIDKEFWKPFSLGGGRYRHPYREGEYSFQRDDRLRSLYYDYEGARAGVNRQTLAAELDRDVTGATAQLCDGNVLKEAMTRCEEPCQEGALLPGEEPGEWEPAWSFGQDLQLWIELDVDGKPPVDDYVMGADISAGTGGSYSSYSALAIFSRSTGQQVLQWRSNKVNQLVFAGLAKFVGMWFHEAYFVPEINGPLGTQFINELMKLGYPRVYRQKRGKKTYQEDSESPGYWNSDSGVELLTTLEAGIKSQKAVVKSRLCLKEMGNYFYRNGKLVQAKAQSDEDEGARGQAHGDMAIATGAAWWGIRNLPKWEEQVPEKEIPADCFLARQKLYQDQSRANRVTPYWSPFEKTGTR